MAFGHPNNSIEDWTLFYIDKGNTFNTVLAALTGSGNDRYCRMSHCPKFDPQKARQVLEALIEQGVLACGAETDGGDRELVVREWSPNKARSLDQERDQTSE